MIHRTAKVKLDDMLRSRKHRPIEHEWEDILADHDIHFQQYYTMSLIGEHIHRLLKHCDDICSRTEDLILRNLALSPDPKTTVARVRQFMDQMLELMKCFDFLSSVMCRMEKQDEETIETF